MMSGSVYLFLNIGGPEFILIFFVALLLFGGEKLPGIARTLGRGIRDFKDASEDVKREINSQINSFDEKREKKAEIARAMDEETHTDTEAPAPEQTENLSDDNIVDEHNNNGDAGVDNDSEVQQEEAKTPDFTKPANTVEYKG